MNLERAYQLLLGLYPYDYRALFAKEMEIAFEQAAAERRQQPMPALLRFLLIEFVDLLAGATVEWIAKLTTSSSVRGRCLPDLRFMRPTGVPQELWFAEPCLNARHGSLPQQIMQAQERIEMLIHHMVEAIANHDFPGARRYSYEERQARNELRRLREKYSIYDSQNNGGS